MILLIRYNLLLYIHDNTLETHPHVQIQERGQFVDKNEDLSSESLLGSSIFINYDSPQFNLIPWPPYVL